MFCTHSRTDPHEINHPALCFSSQRQTDHPHLLLQRATSPITSSPDLLFPLCWAQCSFLTRCSLIRGLLAYLNLKETKHVSPPPDLLRTEALAALCGKLSRHVRHDRHVLSQERWGKNWGRAYLFAESWPFWAHDVQLAEKIPRERMMAVRAPSLA